MKNRYIYTEYVQYYKENIIGALLSVAAAFFAVALVTFNGADRSLFTYYTHYDTATHNLAGSIGAYIAALFYHLFGVACLLCIPLCMFCIYLVMSKQFLAVYWERICAGIMLIPLCAALMHAHMAHSSACVGGYIGQAIVRLLNIYCDTMCVLLLLYTLIIGAIVLLFRFTCIRAFFYVVQLIQDLCTYETLYKVCYVIGFGLWLLTRPVVWLCQAIIQLSVSDEVPQSITGYQVDARTYMQDMQVTASKNYTLFQVDEDTSVQESISTEEPKREVCFEEIISKSNDLKSETIGYALPNLNIFIGNPQERDNPEVLVHLQERAQLLEQKLERFGITGRVVAIKRGPVVTLFEYQPDIDSKISKIIALEDDLALALEALSIRIIAPIPGKPFVGFEVSNVTRKSVALAHVLHSNLFENFEGHLPLALGQDTIGNNVVVDLVRMPHLLVAGSTGSGKSVALNSMLVSLLCKLTPEELRLVLIDPKRLEFAAYADIAHLLFPIVTQPQKAAPVLRWIVQQMEERYEHMAQYGARNIQDFNNIMCAIGKQRLPFIVLIIDELADLMMTAGREIEGLIARITQMARASGIHLIVATQRPSVDVITGLIKVNFPSRISFRVTSKIDSRTILDCSGADKLLGRGDMLFLDSQDACLKRLHGAYVSDAEIEQLVAHIRKQKEVVYLSLDDELNDKDDVEKDEIYNDVLTYLDEVDEISISLLQRKFRIGYNRSARIIDMLESEGLISAAGNGKTRSVIR